MLHLLALSTILADGVTIRIGDNVWTFGWNFIVYLAVAVGDYPWVSLEQSLRHSSVSG